MMLVLIVPPPAQGATASFGQLYAFGDNQWGQLGNPVNNMDHGEIPPNPAPTLVPLPGAIGPVTQVAAGGDHSLALTSSGQLFAFGSNYFGQIGNKTNNLKEEANPTPTLVALPGQADAIAQIAAGRYHSLAVTSTGQLYAFGDNNWGQLGNSTNTGWSEAANPEPTRVTLPDETGPVTYVAAGAYHSLAVTSTGELYAFGDNNRGQLGSAVNDGSEPGQLQPNPTPIPVTLPGEDGPVVQAAAGAWFSLAVTSTGQLYAFGENRFGELGNSTNAQTTEPNPTPTLVTLPGADAPVTQVAAGFSHSLALTSTGRLYAFGENMCGQLGNPINDRTQKPNPTPTPVTLPGATGPVIRIAAGGSDSLALTSTGQLYAFGCDPYGELGMPPGAERLAPHPTPDLVMVANGTNIDMMASGAWSNHTLVVMDALAVIGTAFPAAEVDKPYSVQAQGTGGDTPYSWAAINLPPGISIDEASGAISGIPTATGTYTPTITLTDRHGIQAVTEANITVTAKGNGQGPQTPGQGPQTPGQGPQTPGQSTPPPEHIETPPSPSPSPSPSLLNVRQSATRWREGDALAHLSRAKGPIGTVFSLVLNEQATLSFRFIQLRRPPGQRCAARRHTILRSGGCLSRIPRGTLSLLGHSSLNSLAFGGRISRRDKLDPGRYEVLITATNSTGQHSAPASLIFAITRP